MKANDAAAALAVFAALALADPAIRAALAGPILPPRIAGFTADKSAWEREATADLVLNPDLRMFVPALYLNSGRREQVLSLCRLVMSDP